ncbi:MAG: hypothetical protein ACTSXQ_01735 [Alphaproteobacteria bacterium]
MKEEIEIALQEVVAEFSLAQQAFDAGKVIDLTPLGQNVDAVCKKIQTMPKEEAVLFDAPLQALISALDTFIGEYETFLNTAPETGANAAAAAYKKQT